MGPSRRRCFLVVAFAVNGYDADKHSLTAIAAYIMYVDICPTLTSRQSLNGTVIQRSSGHSYRTIEKYKTDLLISM